MLRRDTRLPRPAPNASRSPARIFLRMVDSSYSSMSAAVRIRTPPRSSLFIIPSCNHSDCLLLGVLWHERGDQLLRSCLLDVVFDSMERGERSERMDRGRADKHIEGMRLLGGLNDDPIRFSRGVERLKIGGCNLLDQD